MLRNNCIPTPNSNLLDVDAAMLGMSAPYNWTAYLLK